MNEKSKLSPMMQQYMAMKEQYKDTLLFFRLGDFYEMFFDDAILVSRELELTLTGRDCGMQERAPMCGVPFHAVDVYVNRLLEKGYKVAICEQLTDPALSKGLVDRDVVRIITPGTVIESSILDEKSNNYLLALYQQGTQVGLALSLIHISARYRTRFFHDRYGSSQGGQRYLRPYGRRRAAGGLRPAAIGYFPP